METYAPSEILIKRSTRFVVPTRSCLADSWRTSPRQESPSDDELSFLPRNCRRCGPGDRPSSLLRCRSLEVVSQQAELVDIQTCPTDKAEAEFVVHSMERLIGGSTFFSLDSGRVENHDEGESYSFSDFAVLYRTDAQADLLAEALARSGIPFQKKSHGGLMDEPARRAIIDALRGLLDSAGRARLPCRAAFPRPYASRSFLPLRSPPRSARSSRRASDAAMIRTVS